MAEARQDASIQPQHTGTLLGAGITWEELRELTAYVEERSGDLLRVPQEALITSASPIIALVSNGPAGSVA